MTWWMRPGPRRFWASRNASPRSPSVFASGTRTPAYRTSQWVFQARPAWPITTSAAATSSPGVSVGTRIIVPAPVGLGIRIGDREHDPERRRRRPRSRTTFARRSPTRPRRAPPGCGAGSGRSRRHRARSSRRTTARAPRRAARGSASLCSGVPNWCRISALPASGAWQPKTSCAQCERPISSFMQA